MGAIRVHFLRKELHGTFAMQLNSFFFGFRVHSASNPHPCTRIGRGLYPDWTRIVPGLYLDWTRIVPGLDPDCLVMMHHD